jgi:hypothetical protein
MTMRCAAGSLSLALAALAVPARAADAPADVDISRITLRLPDAGWKVSGTLPFGVAVQDSGLTVGGESRLLVAGVPGTRDELVMHVSATRGQGRVTMHAECDAEGGIYVRKFNRGQSNYIPLQCLRVEGPVRLPADPAAFGDGFAAAMAAQHVAPPPDGYVVSLTVCNENGAIVEILALAGSHLVGLDARPAVAAVPQGMPPAVVAWADRLAEEALGTLSSWSGRMSVPPVVFKTPASRPEPLNTAQAGVDTTED